MKAYVESVCRLTGYGGKEALSEEQWPKLIEAMAVIESGLHLTKEEIDTGLNLYKTTTKP